MGFTLVTSAVSDRRIARGREWLSARRPAEAVLNTSGCTSPGAVNSRRSSSPPSNSCGNGQVRPITSARRKISPAERRGDKGRNDRKFLEALHYFVVHNITWRALPEKFGHWNSVWKRFWRLSRSGTFQAFFDALAAMSETAHLVQMFDSTVVRAHVRQRAQKGAA